MVTPGGYTHSAWSDEENSFGHVTLASLSTPDGCLPSGSRGSAIPSLSVSTDTNETNLELTGLEDFDFFLASGLSLDPHESAIAVSASDPTPRQVAWMPPCAEDGLGAVITEEPEIIDVVRSNDDDLSWWPSGASYPSNLDSQSLSFVQNVEDTLWNSLIAVEATSLVEDWCTTQRQIEYPFERPPVLDSVVPTIGGVDPSHSLENIQVVDVESLPYNSLPTVEQVMVSSRPVRTCEWKDPDGTVCGDLVTRASLAGHLSKHGIKNQTRGHPIKCGWSGCKRKKHMNRESIVRHIREVHLCMKRDSKHTNT